MKILCSIMLILLSVAVAISSHNYSGLHAIAVQALSIACLLLSFGVYYAAPKADK